MQDRKCRIRIMDKGFFAGKNVLVMGLGRFGGGVDAAKFVCSSGAKVTVTDLASAEQLSDSIELLKEFPDIKFRLGSHNPADFEQADIVIANPAVTPDNQFLETARRANKTVTSQIEIFFELCAAQIVGITGAVGKSTTAALTAHLLRAAVPADKRTTQYENVRLSGNIGNEPLLTVVEQTSSDDLVVLELSSFQIEQLARIKKAPDVALLTNLTPNHLDRYGSFDAYCRAKENIFKYQKLDGNRSAISIFNAEDKIAAQWFEKYSEEAGRVCIKFSADDVSGEIRKHFGLPGRANLSNLAAALAVAGHFGIDDDTIKNCLAEFKPLPHRLQFVSEINGVKWYNDSKATTAEGAIAAMEAFEQPKIIIAGGYDKNISFDKLGKAIAQAAKAAILIGQTAQKIAEATETKLATENTEKKTKVEVVDSLAEAVRLANNLAQAGDVVLFSPACASYDMFDNYQHRGSEFVSLVREISV